MARPKKETFEDVLDGPPEPVVDPKLTPEQLGIMKRFFEKWGEYRLGSGPRIEDLYFAFALRMRNDKLL